MHSLRSGAARLACALTAVSLAGTAAAQDVPALREAYPSTLHFGTGLVTIPTAWVSPRSGSLWIQATGTGIDYAEGLNAASQWNTNLSIETHWFGRVSVGAALYSQNPDFGFFGQVMLVRDGQAGGLPGIAVGVRNVGPRDHEDRYLVAHDVTFTGDPEDAWEDVVSPWAREFDTAPTVYAVATKGFGVGRTGAGSVSLGWGNGLFADDGELGTAYNENGQLVEGLFLGGRIALHPTMNTTITFMAENNGWDWNAGVVGDWRGVTLGVYGLELEEGGKEMGPACAPLCGVYNYSKIAVALGYNGNVFDIGRGVLLRSRVAELTREQQRLRAEISARERQVAALEVELRRAQAGELAEIARRRERLEAQIQQEREAIRQAEERLRQLEQGRPRPSTPPPSSH